MGRKVGRPINVTLLIFIVLIITASNLTRLARTASQWDFVSELVYIKPIYLVLSGLVWGLLGVCVVRGLWRPERWSISLAKIGAIAYTAYLWIDRIFIGTYRASSKDNLFAFVFSVIILIWIFWTFSRPDVKDYFGVTNE
jgi:membrane associated rhomboid family serine protease